HEITTVDITNALRRCNLSGAPGYDGVIYNAISKVHQSQPQLLTGLYNACLTVGHYPTAWKHAICVLIPKPGRDPSLIKAYRPISLLPNVGKILENILALKLTDSAIRCGAISPTQFGGVPYRSTNDALLQLLTPCSEALQIKSKVQRKDRKNVPVPRPHLLGNDIAGGFNNIDTAMM